MSGASADTNTQQESSEEQSNKFAGFSAVDGVIQKPPAAAKAAKAPAAVEEETETDEEKADREAAEAAAAAGKPKPRSAQSRIDKAIANQRSAERRAEGLQRQIDEIKAGLTGKPAATTTAASSEAEPDPKKYDGGEFDPKYIRDLARYEARVALKETTAAAQTTSQAQQAEQAAAEWTERRDAFTEKASETYPDFAEVVFDDSNKFSSVIVQLTMESEQGAQIAYELANDPKGQRELAKLSAVEQVKWFVRRELEISSAADAGGDDTVTGGEGSTVTKKPKAPPPPGHKPRNNGGTGGVNAATDDFAAFERMAMAGNKK